MAFWVGEPSTVGRRYLVLWVGEQALWVGEPSTVGTRTWHCGRKAHCRLGRNHSTLSARAANSNGFRPKQRAHVLPTYIQVEAKYRILTEVKA